MSRAAYSPLPLPSLGRTVWAFGRSLPTLPAADFCRPVRRNRSLLSPDSGTNGRSPEVSSTAFRTQPSDLQPAPLMDMGFAVIRPLAQRRMPHIRFLFIGSHVCSTLLSDLASRRRRCASLSLHLHQVVKGTFTPKLSNLLGTRKYPPAKPGALVCEPLKAAAGSLSRPRKTMAERYHNLSWCLLQAPVPVSVLQDSESFTEPNCRHPAVSIGRSHLRIGNMLSSPPTYCRICQTSAASPAEPGGLPTD